jgi:hypothetical protein
VQAAITGAGFRPVAWDDQTAAALAWFQGRLAAVTGTDGPPPLGIHLLLGPAVPEMLANFVRNLAEGRIVVVQAVFAR